MKSQQLILTIALILLFHANVHSQHKLLTLDDVVLSTGRDLTPNKLKQLKWIENSSELSYITNNDKHDELMVLTPPSKEAKTILSIITFNSSLKTAGYDTILTFPVITWKDRNNFFFTHLGETLGYSLAKNEVRKILNNPGKEIKNLNINSEHSGLIYTVGNNLWLMKPAGPVQITFDTNTNILNGFIVHREEFGIHQGSYWSPKNNLFAFYRMDETMVTDYPILELDDQPSKTKNIKYPMAGGVSHHVTIGVYDLRTNQTIFLETGLPADQYLTNISWSPDETKIYVGILNRGQDHLKMNRYDATTGKFEITLFEEKDEKYVHPLNPVVFSPKGNNFIWQSRRDGYNHLYLYDLKGKLINQLTKGNWEVIDFYGFDESGRNVFYSGNSEYPINRDIYKCEIKSGNISKISSGTGVHKASISSKGDFYIDEFSGPGIPSTQSVYNTTGKVIITLLESPDPLLTYSQVSREIFTIKSEKGEDLFCRMVKPFPFDSTQKYPVIVYVYGGPGLQLITNSWTGGADLWSQYMAQRGFIIFTLENRGTPNRGKDFEQSTFRNLGEIEMLDQITGVKHLMKQPYVDHNRVGVYGWSYGGFMSISLMTRHPGVFKAAVAGGPVIDWSYYEVMYTERYMDTPAENPQGYSKSNLLNYVENLNGKMLLIHGTSDDVVVWQHSLLYLKKAIEKNVHPDYFVYPGHGHGIRGRERVHLLTKVSNYFFDYLK